MPVIRTGETEADKELARWDAPKRLGGERADGYEPFPKMLYKAVQRKDGVVVCTDVDPSTGAMYGGTTQIVQDEAQLARALKAGWREGPLAALEQFERERQGVAQAAAEEAYRVLHMGAKARAEFQAVEASEQIEHVVDVPAPKLPATRVRKKRGRPAKASLKAVPADLTVTP
jgi:microcystin degradation protein MlrC